MTGLQDRVDAAGGTLTIVSELGGGTTLRDTGSVQDMDEFCALGRT